MVWSCQPTFLHLRHDGKYACSPSGWSSRTTHHTQLAPSAYFLVITDLTIVDDVVCLGDRLVIPSSLRQACLTTLHTAHQRWQPGRKHPYTGQAWQQTSPPQGAVATFATDLTCHPQPQRRRTTRLSTFTQTSSTMKIRLPRAGGSLLGMAHHIAGKAEPQASYRDLRNLRHAHHRWRTQIHRPCNKRSADQLGGGPPPAYHPHANNHGSKPSSGSSLGTPTPGMPWSPEVGVFQPTGTAPARTRGCHRPLFGRPICYLPSQHDFNSQPRTVPPSTRGRQHSRSANPWARTSTPRASPPSNAETEYWCKTRQATTQPEHK